MECNNGNAKLDDDLVKIIKQYAELVKDANEKTEIGPHINFTRYKKFKNVRGWFESFTDKPNEKKKKNLIRIFTTGSSEKGLDYKIRERYGINKETEDRLINANQQGGSFINLIKKINDLTSFNESHFSEIDTYLNNVILEVSKIYKKEGDKYKFTDFERKNYKDLGVFKELLFLLNIELDEMPLENGCYYDALGIINETLNSDFTYKGNEEKRKFVGEIESLIEKEKTTEIPKYLLLDQFFNVIDKIKYVELDNINDNSKEFYFELFRYFNKKSKYFRQNKSLMNIFNNNKNTILHGPPGTGKTYQITQYFKDNANKEEYKYIVFHPNYGYEDFIDGIKPRFENGQIQLELVNGYFKEFCIDVHRDNLEFIAKNVNLKKNLPKYYFVVDEINRANLSAVFGETLMLLEDSYRYKYFNEDGGKIDNQMNRDSGRLITLKNSNLCTKKENWFEKIDEKVLFGIPENIYFIGMMNDVDRSIDSFDLALRRRFAWIERGYDKTVIINELGLEDKDKYLIGINNVNKFLLEELSSSAFQLGHSYFLKIKDYGGPSDNKAVENLFNNHLKPLIKEYLRTEYPENEIKEKIEEALKKFLEPFTNADNKKQSNESLAN
ncbi:MAG: AAA family ATPase [Flavobacteriaceae bacterium]|nr:AAA family ATPase [Flavobacteriaceae bacterium]